MIGSNTEKDFKIENYEEFYEHHHFEPIPIQFAFTANEVIPRFGWAFDKVSELKPKMLLDLGCLDGSFALSVADQLGIYTHGVDLTQDGIDIANERSKIIDTPTRFTQGRIEDWLVLLEESGEKFECITCFEVLEHVEDPELLLNLIDKLLAPGGSVLISTPAFESPTFGKDDEENKCHIRLYTMKDEDYEEANKYGNVRKATSITKAIGKDRIKEMGVVNELINLHYQ